MKFKELPEGLYQITDVDNSLNKVFVQPLENPDNIPLSLFIPEPVQVVHDGRSYNDKGYFFPKNLDAMDASYKTYEEVRKERKARNASYGHVQRRLLKNEPLKGKTLDLALSLVTCDDPNAGVNKDPFAQGIAKKLKAGQPLDDYEIHMMVDVWLLHAKLH
ncbi:MAG: hypothetical protein V4596_01760 [Bdellovibrionota bacterium]